MELMNDEQRQHVQRELDRLKERETALWTRWGDALRSRLDHAEGCGFGAPSTCCTLQVKRMEAAERRWRTTYERVKEHEQVLSQGWR